MRQVAALFVETGGAYFGLDGVEPWDRTRDARTYAGPHPVVAHPPCERWGRYWGGAPLTSPRLRLGDDGGCFATALHAVRLFGGVLEHPEGHAVVSWQGIRRDESDNRRAARMFEAVGDGLFVYRPIARWTADEVFDHHRKRGIEPNPLYKLGMRRVGCMPCINCRKSELAEIARRFPEHIERIAEWESIVAAVSKRGGSTFFAGHTRHADPSDREAIIAAAGIRPMVEWAKTSRGGKQYDLEAFMPPPACASSYGLCE